MLLGSWQNLLKSLTKRIPQFGRRQSSRSRLRTTNRTAAEILEFRTLLSAAVVTDLLDYMPGETAAITASGFVVGETVQFQVTRTDGIQDYPSGNLPWQVTDGSAQDLDGIVNGNISTTWFVEDQYAGASMLLSATGLSSDEIATEAFTDATLTTSTVTVTPSPTNAPPKVTATVAETGSGAVNIAAAEFSST